MPGIIFTEYRKAVASEQDPNCLLNTGISIQNDIKMIKNVRQLYKSK